MVSATLFMTGNSIIYYVLDIDECALNLHECAKNEVCVNGDGFYYCEDPNNPDADSEDGLDKCPEGYHFNGEKLVCDGNIFLNLYLHREKILFLNQILMNVLSILYVQDPNSALTQLARLHVKVRM